MINAYIPTDHQTINYDGAELLDVVTEIENIVDNGELNPITIKTQVTNKVNGPQKTNVIFFGICLIGSTGSLNTFRKSHEV